MHETDEGGINWKRTGLIVGAVVALGLGTQLIPDIGMSFDDEQRNGKAEEIAERVSDRISERVSEARERRGDAAQGLAQQDELALSDDPEVRMEALGMQMEALADRLDTAEGAEREEIESQMGDIGAEMAKTGIDLARRGFSEAFGE